ncbi:hypothetical protein FB45DRAFT_1064946 [Roridomyces roridus]|uniref:F-box domain-containing protein n=1 Tax=Roridomyces roridus TaxID=1738132 RepID=A0AAD7B9D8_9AGAR|nr:hypothetical protein FB45DRAFT_1064946 [Roridomyces roridus]
MVLTRRAHRARMLITLWLPNEVLTEIIQYANRPDQAALCRVSRLFHGLVLPILNRAISLRLVDKEGRPYEPILTSLLQSLIRNPERADAVQSLSFIRKWAYKAPVDYDLLTDSIKLMRNLESLSFNDYRERTIITRLACLSFPNLSRCRIRMSRIGVSAAMDLATFLSQHHSIVRLVLRIPGIQGGANSLEPGLNLLPNLRQYQGTGLFFDRLATRYLQAAQFLLSEIESDVQALKSITNPHVPFVLSREFASRALDNSIQKILSPLSVELPLIGSLQLRVYDIHTGPLGIDALQYVAAQLPNFTQIAYFSLTSPELEFFVDAESDQAAFETWVAAASTLIGCCIGNVARRKFREEWEPLSVEDFHKQAGFSVFEPIWPDDD